MHPGWALVENVLAIIADRSGNDGILVNANDIDAHDSPRMNF